MKRSKNIIRKIKSGDTSCFRELFNYWKIPIFNFVVKMIGNPTDAEDITQEVFLNVYKNINSLKKEELFKQWLFTIAKNLTLNWIAKNAQQDKKFSQQENHPFFERNSSPEEKLISNELEQLIEINLNKMPTDYKLAFVLSTFNEFEYNEISHITGWSLAKVKTTIHRARLFMRDKLRPHIKE